MDVFCTFLAIKICFFFVLSCCNEIDAVLWLLCPGKPFWARERIKQRGKEKYTKPTSMYMLLLYSSLIFLLGDFYRKKKKKMFPIFPSSGKEVLLSTPNWNRTKGGRGRVEGLLGWLSLSSDELVLDSTLIGMPEGSSSYLA